MQGPAAPTVRSQGLPGSLHSKAAVSAKQMLKGGSKGCSGFGQVHRHVQVMIHE